MKKQITIKTAVALMVITSALSSILLLGGLALHYGLDSSSFEELRTYLALRRDIEEVYIGEYDSKSVSEAALSAIVTALDDKWSYYMTPEEYKDYINAANNQYAGLGISVQKDEATGGIKIMSVFAGSSAETAGLVTGDIITGIDGKEITSLALQEATALIDRELGQSIRMTLLGQDGKTREVEAVFAIVNTNPISYELMSGNIGLIRIKNFDGSAGDEFISAADALVEQGATSFIFDVRNNGGGRVSELKIMLDYLLPECDIFISVGKNGTEDVSVSGPDNVKLPAVVLVNGYSYSAAEYFAAALKEYNYAAVVGEQTTGKNRSQITLELPDGGALHISSGEYLTPNRVSLTEQGGLTPDAEVVLSAEENTLLYAGQLEQSRDTQLQRAIKLLK